MSNKLDQFYRSLVLTKYFTKGWGKPENLKRICEFRKIVSDREACYKLVSSEYPVYIERELDCKSYTLFDGYFYSPLAQYLPEVVPLECYKAYFQLILPKKWHSEKYKPVVLQIAGTGDQYYWRRRNLIAKPLIKEAGIGSVILENPFYGRRKPLEQRRTVLHNVSDIFVMGGCLILESMVLFHFCERLGYGPLGVTGLSMGGHMASLAATCWPKPLIVVPCLSGLTASSVFTQGVISGALNWNMLEKQFHSDLKFKEEIANVFGISRDDAFRAGQKFAIKNLSSNSTVGRSDCNFGCNDADNTSSVKRIPFGEDGDDDVKIIESRKSCLTFDNTAFDLCNANDGKSSTFYRRKTAEKNENSNDLSSDSKSSFSTLSENPRRMFKKKRDKENPTYSCIERQQNKRVCNTDQIDANHQTKIEQTDESILRPLNSLINLSTLLTYTNFRTKNSTQNVTSFGTSNLPILLFAFYFVVFQKRTPTTYPCAIGDKEGINSVHIIYRNRNT